MSFLKWNKKIQIELFTLLRSFLIIDDAENKYIINKTGEDILLAFNGSMRKSDIVEFLMKKYDDTEDIVTAFLDEYLDVLREQYNLFPVEISQPETTIIPVTGEVSFYPHVASIELTDKCNVACRHCYGMFGSHCTKHLSLENAKRIIKNLYDSGVFVIELTGGEITTYPHLIEIIDYALTFPFHKISLLSNGIDMSDALKSIILANKHRIQIQIDLHSLKSDYLNWFMGTKADIKTIQENIRFYVDNQVKVRLATIFTSKNLDEFPIIAEYTDKLGVVWSPSIVEPVGRAADYKKTPELFLTESEFVVFSRYCEEYSNKHSHMAVQRSVEERANEYNCGVLTEHVVINSEGKIKICTMDNGVVPNTTLGDVIIDNLKDIYDRNKVYIEAFVMQEPPTFDEIDCQGCEYYGSCVGCLFRSIHNAFVLKGKCKWYNNKMSQTIKEKLNLS